MATSFGLAAPPLFPADLRGAFVSPASPPLCSDLRVGGGSRGRGQGIALRLRRRRDSGGWRVRFCQARLEADGMGDGGEGDGEGLGRKRLVRTLLIDNYDSYTYNIYQELSVINGVPPVVIYNDEWTWDHVHRQLYEEKAFDNIVISPGPGTPACPADIGICLQVLLECDDIPILGVCLGHQALGLAHGAQIVHAPEPIHGRLSEVEHAGCELFSGIPSGRNSGLKVVRYHSLVIDPNSLPADLIPIAWTTSAFTVSFLDSQGSDIVSYELGNQNNRYQSAFNSNVLMGIKHSNRPHYGVQFHPESIGTSYGRQMLKNFKRLTINYGLRSVQHPDRKICHTQHIPEDLCSGKLAMSKSAMTDYFHIHKHANILPESIGGKHLKLQWKKLAGLSKQIGGPSKIFLELFGDQNADDTFWLDSSSTEQRRARFSFMGGKGGSLWKQLTFWLSDQRDTSTKGGGFLKMQDAKGSVRRIYLKDGFLDFLDKELQSFHYDEEDYKGLPFDFCGGFVGFIGYNLKVECGALLNRHQSKMADACFFFADNIVAIDHSNDDVYILSIHDTCQTLNSNKMVGKYLNWNHWMDEAEKRLIGLRAVTKKLRYCKPPVASSSSHDTKFIVERSRSQYMKDVQKCLEFIRDGESYELCLTTQMKMRVTDLNALRLYLDLRNQNPAPYAAWLNFSKDNLCICCSSPERFLRLDREGVLEAKPIKGTISRGTTIREDELHKLQLQNSEKDQAENLMIVDLLRNDLGRVCESGTVHVPCLMEVESYATVHTLVSTIQGKKKPNLSPIDCVKAAFPGGSMTGAPKLRSMEILDSLECSPRGVYSGSIGFFSYNQTFDLNIVIRTVVIHEEEASIGAGGAVVALSNPEDEYEEMLLKAGAPARAVEMLLDNSDSSDRRFMMAT